MSYATECDQTYFTGVIFVSVGFDCPLVLNCVEAELESCT